MAIILGSGRPAESKNRIVEDFRTRIVTGDLHPGSRFPTRSEIEEQYGAGATTVQRALELLRDDGFIRVNGRRGGTFVADNPPHLSRYAVVFPHKQSYGRFWDALSQESEIISQERPDCQLVTYYGVDGFEESKDFLRLSQEVSEHRVAGLIFTSYPYLLWNTPLLDEPNIPRVAIMTPEPDKVSLPLVWADVNLFLVRALDELKRQGHRRIAFLKNTFGMISQNMIDEMLKERGLETRTYWCQSADVTSAEGARNCMQLLMYCSELPDALVICDDNLVESATTGLQDVQHKVPAEFEVIAHANFPYPTPCQFSARRLGFDIREILQLCVENLNTQRQGGTVPSVTKVAASFESDIATPRRR